MTNRCAVLCGCVLLSFAPCAASAEQLASPCRITDVDVAARMATLVRKTATGERTGVAKVADGVIVTIDGQAATLKSLTLPTDATVVYDTSVNAVVEIRVAKNTGPAGPGPASKAPPLAVAPFDAAKAKEHQEAWAKYLGVPVEMTNSIGMEFVLIPPGEFEMGSRQADIDRLLKAAIPVSAGIVDPNTKQWYAGFIDVIPSEGPQHHVRLTKASYFGAYEVTVRQFREFEQATRYRTTAEQDGKGGWGFNSREGKFEKNVVYTWENAGFRQDDASAVMNVTWNDATVFCEWVSSKEGKKLRLPTEAEWEFACRAGTATDYSSGDGDSALQGVANTADLAFKNVIKDAKVRANEICAVWDDGFAYTSPVGSFRQNGFGLFDMHGNVWEWCLDWYAPDYYKKSPTEDPIGPMSGTDRVKRGGGWRHFPAACRSAYRNFSPPLSCQTYGFRVVCEIGP